MSDWATVTLSLVHIAVIVGYVVICARRSDFDLLSPSLALLACQFVTFGMRPILLCWDQPRFGAFWPVVGFSDEGFRFAAVCGLISTIGLIWGLSAGRVKALPPTTLRDTRRRSLTLALFAIGIVFAILALRSRLGRAEIDVDLDELMLGRTRSRIGAASVGYGYETLGWILVPAYLAAVSARYLGHQPARPIFVVALLVGALLVLAPIGGRELIASSIVIVIYVWHYRFRRLTGPRYALLTLLVIAVAAGIGQIRSQPDGSWSLLDGLAHLSNSFDGFEALVALADRFSGGDILWGRSYFESIFFTYIPRAIWTAKPIFFGSLACQMYVYTDISNSQQNIGTFPVGFVAEALLNFWYPGILLVPYLLGRFVIRLEKRAVAPSDSGFYAGMSGIFVGGIISCVRSLGDTALGLLVSSAILALMLGTKGGFVRQAGRSQALFPALRPTMPSQGRGERSVG